MRLLFTDDNFSLAIMKIYTVRKNNLDKMLMITILVLVVLIFRKVVQEGAGDGSGPPDNNYTLRETSDGLQRMGGNKDRQDGRPENAPHATKAAQGKSEMSPQQRMGRRPASKA